MPSYADERHPGRLASLLPPHRPVPGDDFMPAGWCGGCEVCDRYPVPTVCVRCSYDDETGWPVEPAYWPCPHALPKWPPRICPVVPAGPGEEPPW